MRLLLLLLLLLQLHQDLAKPREELNRRQPLQDRNR